MLEILNGRKTYLVALLTALYGVLGYFLGQVSLDEGVKLVLSALGMGAFRSALSKME